MASSSRPDPAAALVQILARMQDPILTKIALYWRSKLRSDGGLPAHADIEPAEMPAFLPYLFLVDVEPAPLRYLYRLVGVTIVEWAGNDITGLYLDQAYPDAAGRGIEAEYRAVVESGLPRYQEFKSIWPNREHRFYGRIVLPLARDGVHVDVLLGAINVPGPKQAR
jgi:hypothetical protein